MKAWKIASREFSNCWAPSQSCANLNGAFRMVSNYRALHEIACVDLRKVCQRTAELKREADATHEVRGRHPNFGCLGWLVRETANATHSLRCGVRERESNETKSGRKPTEMLEEWQRLLQQGSSASHSTSEVISAERQR